MSHFFDQVRVIASICLRPAGWCELMLSISVGFCECESFLSPILVTAAVLTSPEALGLSMLREDRARLAVRSSPVTFAVAISGAIDRMSQRRPVVNIRVPMILNAV